MQTLFLPFPFIPVFANISLVLLEDFCQLEPVRSNEGLCDLRGVPGDDVICKEPVHEPAPLLLVLGADGEVALELEELTRAPVVGGALCFENVLGHWGEECLITDY